MKCPTCSKEVRWENNPNRPFCSERCQMVDLGKWVSEEYRVPGSELPRDADKEPSGDDGPQDE